MNNVVTTTTVSSNIDNQIVNDTTPSVQSATTQDTESTKETESTESQGAEIQSAENGSPEKQDIEKDTASQSTENQGAEKQGTENGAGSQSTEKGVDSQGTENGEEAPITNEIKVNLIGDGVVELKRLDGSVSGTVFGNKTNQTEKPSAMDIARQIASKQEVTDIPVKISAADLKKRRSSVPAPIGPIRQGWIFCDFRKKTFLEYLQKYR